VIQLLQTVAPSRHPKSPQRIRNRAPCISQKIPTNWFSTSK
jgi:hypothetical protein